MICKLTDFGFACVMDPQQKMTLSLGSPLYMAPEVINSRSYTSKVDIWSLGVITYILLTGKIPFMGQTKAQIFKNAQHKEVDYKDILKYKRGPQAKHFIERCLQRDPSERWDAATLLDHPWIEKLTEAEEISETELVEAGMNIYSFKQASLFQSAVIAMLAGMK